MAAPTAFQALLFERANALLSHELVTVRDQVLGAQQLAQWYLTGQLHLGVTPTLDEASSPLELIIKLVRGLVHEAAWGEAALRYTGVLPPVAVPFTGDVTAAVEASQPRWADVEAQLKNVTVNQQSSRMKCSRIQVEETSAAWLNAVRLALNALQFPKDDNIYFVPQANIDKALENLPSLSPELLQEATEGSSQPSFALLEAYRSRGEQVRNAIANVLRLEANKEVARAEKLKGAAKAEAYDAALELQSMLTTCAEHALIAHCNRAAVHLTLKNYQDAIDDAEAALTWLKQNARQPTTYADRRTHYIDTFNAGKVVTVPPSRLRRKTKVEKQQIHELLWKAYLRKSRGYMGLALAQIDGSQGPCTDANIAAARKFQNQWRIANMSAASLMPGDPTAIIDSGTFSVQFSYHMDRVNAKVK